MAIILNRPIGLVEMRFKIRFKFLAIICIAAALPLLTATLTILTLGYSRSRTQHGTQFQTYARNIAGRLNQAVKSQTDHMTAWLSFSDFAHLARNTQTSLYDMTIDDVETMVGPIEKRWLTLEEDDPELYQYLNNPLAAEMHRFTEMFPLFAEVFVTDPQGRLIAATNKTTDYWQADESWWQKAINLPEGKVWIEGINFDNSSNVYSVDIAIPLYHYTNDRPVGVIKAVLNISKLLEGIPAFVEVNPQPDFQVIMEDGKVLVGLFGLKITPMSRRVRNETIKEIERESELAAIKTVEGHSGWLTAPLFDEERDLIGFAQFDLRSASMGVTGGVKKMYVIVSMSEETVLKPAWQEMRLILIVGISVIIIFLAAGLYLADVKILQPLRIIQRAALGIAARTQVDAGEEPSLLPEPDAQPQNGFEELKELEKIKTNDEIEELASGFCKMARRILNYHNQLESEISHRTEAIEGDLKLAREFQSSFLPTEYPHIVGDNTDGAIELHFHHLYRPAASVSGDLLDVVCLGDNRAGLFVADVMGQGARAALITAILHTLFHNHAHKAENTSALMTELNRRFYEIIPHESTFIFATAFYVIIEINDDGIKCEGTSAGHLSPLLLRRSSNRITPLVEIAQNEPALGVIPDYQYTHFDRHLMVNDLLLMLTDGAIEAPNLKDQEFGQERLLKAIMKASDLDAKGINESIMEALHRHMDTVVSPDDICLLSVEITALSRAKSLPLHN